MAESERPNEGELILYQTQEGAVRIEVLYESETFWLNQKKIAELFGVDLRTISEHLRNIYASGELSEQATLRKIRRVQREGNREVSREIEFYNLDAIISVGYRVNSAQATRFRIWATQTLREFVIKGFVLDDERLKLNKRFGKDYFDELLERIREIRASERRFYLKITDIYEQCSIDYDPHAEITQTFFKTVQNKLHWAVTGQTAAEIIAERADAAKPTMGLTTWRNAPHGKILKSDVSIAKNYLIEGEIKELERIVTNHLLLAPENLLANTRAIQARYDIEVPNPAEPLEAWELFDTAANAARACPHFSTEMETGTGKTYVYLRTIFELSRRYGFQKFIIVVPSVAIREGVLKNIEITAEHFRALYNNLPFEHFVYDAKKVNRLRQFAVSNTVQILVINIDAFRKNFTGTEAE